MPDPVAAAVLFDLDGTFADTAPDLGAALNRLREEQGQPPLPLETLRPHTSSGVRGMLGAGFGLRPDDTDYPHFRTRFLAHYETGLCQGTTLFPGIPELVDTLEARSRPWGIVTNKGQRFTLPLLDALGYLKRAACVVSGDSAPRAKPAAHPLRLACALIGSLPHNCLYAGDDLRDIVAGRSAGMRTVAVRYGYLGDGPRIEDWGADHLVDHARDIAALAGLA